MASKTKPSSIDETVLRLFHQVKQQQREIAASEKPQWETTCTMGTNEGSVTDRVNIQTVTDITKLVDITAFLTSKRDYYVTAAGILGVDRSFKWMGYTFDQWVKDIKTRIAQIQLTAKRAELKSLEARLDRLITTEQRRELELAEIQKQLDGA